MRLQTDCWCPPNTRYEVKHIQEIATSGRTSLNFWGWMRAYGPGELTRIDGRFTSNDYIQVLEEVMLPSVRAKAIPEPDPIIFVQDNSSIHTSRMLKQWFAENPEIIVIDWPNKGCDMNPSENLWAIMTQDWDVGEVRTNLAIEQKAYEVWESVRC